MLVESINPAKNVVNTGQIQNQITQGSSTTKKPPSGQPGQESEGRGHDTALLRDVLEVSKSHFDVAGVALNFSVHEQTGTVKVDVTDKETGELIREIPPEQVLDLMAKLDEMMGMIYDEKA